MARTLSSVQDSPKSIKRISSRISTPSRLSAPPKKIAKIATPSKSKMEADQLNPRVLLSKTLEFADPNKSVNLPAKEGNAARKAPASSGPKATFLSKVVACIVKLQNRNGSSRASIMNQMNLDFPSLINEATLNVNLKLALKKGIDTEVLKMAKETGKGSGSFKLTKKELKNHKTETLKINGTKKDASKNSNDIKKVENDNTVEKEFVISALTC